MAPAASILVVEANSASFSDLFTAINTAKNYTGVSVVSLSWGAGEFPSETTTYDPQLTTPVGHAGVSFVAASGDSGSPGMYPAFSSKVLSVGGTTLTLNGSNNIQSETAWSGSGGGISQYQTPQPSYQVGVVTQTTSHRAGPDVAFDANPSTGVPVYDTYNNSPGTPWTKVGGTSFGAPVWSALVAIANQGRALAGLPVLDSPGLLAKIYSMPASNFNDITSGSSGGTTPQAATAGFDLATGRGSPKANLVVSSLVGTAAISGTVFNDANGNGALDGESGLSGWTVYADLNANGNFDVVSTTTIPSTDVTKSITSLNTVTSNNVVAGIVGDIIDLNVKVNISHTRLNDLILTLISPTGTRITLANRVGGSGDHFTNTIFDDSASVSISLGAAPFAGSYQPAGLLSALFDTNPNGTWQLEIQDVVFGTNGTLNSWSIEFTTGDPNTISAANGTYALLNLPGGAYTIRQVLQAGYAQTAPVGGFYNVNVAAGVSLSGQNFGNWLILSSTPTSVSLLAGSDTGSSDSDDLTRLNNSTPADTLQFEITGTIAGATVSLFADGVLVGSAAAGGTTTTITTDGSTALGNGLRYFTARQTEPGMPMSPVSPALAVTIDAAAPTVNIVPVMPDPSPEAVDSIAITFSEAVSGLDLTHLSLSRDAGADLLTGAQSITSGDNVNWTLANLASLTGMAGLYELLLSAAGTPITDAAGNALAVGDSDQFTIMSVVVGRRLFYNNSKYDGNDPAAGNSDDGAIASDKSALLPGGTATFANVSSYSRGINGVMIDLAGSHPSITAADFTFKLGNDNTPGTWTMAPAPSSVTVRAGAGIAGTDRVEIVWADGAIVNTWLQVIVEANGNTGLPQKAGYPVGQGDVFFFGNAVADTGLGDTATMATVNATDELAARNNPASLFNNIPVTNLYDFNRDGLVNTTDQLLARNNPTSVGNVVRFISIANPPAAPEAAPAVAISSGPAASAATVDRDRSWRLAVDQHLSLWGAHWAHELQEPLLDLLATGRRGSVYRRR
jgi:subtilisin-like proprotein convertase family protein